MPLLCLDTATTSPVVALVGDDGELLSGRVVDGRAQAVLAAIDELLDGAAPRDVVEAVVVGIGPGGFTGLRVGVATARGIAETLGVPLHGMSSLLAVAALDASAHPGERVWATIHGGRGEEFAQAFVATSDGAIEAVGEVRAAKVADVDELVGRDRRTDPMVPTPASLARAGHLTRVRARATGEGAFGNGPLPGGRPLAGGDPLGVLPRYGRTPDADPPRMDVRHDELDERDIDALLVLEARCFDTPWTRQMYREEFARPATDAVRLAARDAGANGRLVGAALATRIGGCWHVMNVLVDPVARGRGIASKLVDDLVARTAELGAGDGWTLEVRDGNEAAIALYERHGFASVGRRPGYYEDTGDDAIVMWRYTSAGAEAGR